MTEVHRRAAEIWDLPLVGRTFGAWVLLLACLGGYAAAALTLPRLLADGGGLAYDARAYWQAGRDVLDGVSLYGATRVDGLGAYFYPPIFAQLWAPFALLPELAFAWLWRLLCLVALRYTAGSWRNVGFWLLFPPTVLELGAANVTFPVMAASVAALRGRAGFVGVAAALKFGPALLIPFVWRLRTARRSLLLGIAAFGLVCLVSVVLAPAAWQDYLSAMTSSAGFAAEGKGLIRIMPTAMSDFLLRLALAAALVLVSLRLDAATLSYIASVIAVPTLWQARLSALLAAFTLRARDSR